MQLLHIGGRWRVCLCRMSGATARKEERKEGRRREGIIVNKLKDDTAGVNRASGMDHSLLPAPSSFLPSFHPSIRSFLPSFLPSFHSFLPSFLVA